MTSVQDIVDALLELDASDRGWIMEQLSPAQRQRLAAQLQDDAGNESTSTGIAAATAPASAVPTPAPMPTPRSTSTHNSTSATAAAPKPGLAIPEICGDADLARLMGGSATQVAEIVRREPAWVVQALLGTMSRERSQDVLAQLPPSTRSEVARFASSDSVLTPAVTRFLAHAAARRLHGIDTAVRASRFDRLVDTMRARLRWMPRVRRSA